MNEAAAFNCGSVTLEPSHALCNAVLRDFKQRHADLQILQSLIVEKNVSKSPKAISTEAKTQDGMHASQD